MIVIPQIEITDSILSTSNVEDTIDIAESKATGGITINPTQTIYASGTIVCSSGLASASTGKQFVVGSHTFTFQPARSATGIIKTENIGAAANFAIDIATTINVDASGQVSATYSGNKVIIRAISATASEGNAIPFYNINASVLSFESATHLDGGVSPSPKNGDVIKIGDCTFTFAATRSTAFEITNSSIATEIALNIQNAINTDIPYMVASTATGTRVDLTADASGAGGNLVTLESSVTSINMSGSALTGGVDSVDGIYTAYSSAATYVAGQQVVISSARDVYESLQSSNHNNYPPDNIAGDSPYWLYIGKTNRWKMFDNVGINRTENGSAIVVRLIPGQVVDSIAAMNVDCSAVRVVVEHGGSATYDQTTPCSADGQNVILTNLPAVTPTTIEVTIGKTGKTAKCGNLVIGNKQTWGAVLTNPLPRIGFTDYSIKERDDWGNYFITERSYSRNIEVAVYTPASNLVYLKEQLVTHRTKPIVAIASTRWNVLQLFGFVKDWNIEYSNPAVVIANIVIEEL